MSFYYPYQFFSFFVFRFLPLIWLLSLLTFKYYIGSRNVTGFSKLLRVIFVSNRIVPDTAHKYRCLLWLLSIKYPTCVNSVGHWKLKYKVTSSSWRHLVLYIPVNFSRLYTLPFQFVVIRNFRLSFCNYSRLISLIWENTIARNAFVPSFSLEHGLIIGA